MAIDLFGHSALPLSETARRLDFARKSHPEWFAGPLFLADPTDLGPFGAEIARAFGIEAECRFGLFVHDKNRLDTLGPAVEFLYRVFGTDHLVVTWGMDSVRAPERRYDPMPIG